MIIKDLVDQQAEIASNCGEISAFTIEASAHAFRTLSSSLYADKMQSIVRELSCNARDSHTEAGQDRQWELHLPTTFEPFLAITDFGIGLTDEEVKSIYTTYFKSTKRNSAELIGALGLGSKSPFSYTDNFTVIAVKGGTKNTYSAFIDNSGVPSVIRLDSSETTDPNGVSVQIAVAPSDFYNFRQAAERALRFFADKDMPKCNFNITRERVFTAKYGTSTIETLSTVTQYTQQDSIAVMGGVGYKISREHPKLASIAHLLKMGLIVRFDIGEVEPQPSREALTYTENTINSILTKVNSMFKSMYDAIEAEHDKRATKFERICYLRGLEDQMIRPHAQKLWTVNGYDDISIKLSSPDSDFGEYRMVDYRYGKPRVGTPELNVVYPANSFTVGTVLYINDTKLRISEIKESILDGKIKIGQRSFVVTPGKNFDIATVQPDLCGISVVTFSSLNLTPEVKTKAPRRVYHYIVSTTNYHPKLRRVPSDDLDPSFYGMLDVNGDAVIPTHWASDFPTQYRFLEFIERSTLASKISFVSEKVFKEDIDTNCVKNVWDYLDEVLVKLKTNQDLIDLCAFQRQNAWTFLDRYPAVMQRVAPQLNDPSIHRIMKLRKENAVDGLITSLYNLLVDTIDPLGYSRMQELVSNMDLYSMFAFERLFSRTDACIIQSLNHCFNTKGV